MPELDIPYETLTPLVFVGLLILIFRFPDLTAVIIIVASLAGLALNWMSRQYNTEEDEWPQERRKWEEGDRWW
ncbi:MAG: hypothetical protein ABEL51_16160 [Salinibacter sp.]